MRSGCASDTTAKETAALVDGRVSIITPCYNGERFIAETILSVMIQTYALTFVRVPTLSSIKVL